MLLFAIVPKGTFVGILAAFRKIDVRFLLAIDNLHGLFHASRHLQVFIIHHLLYVMDDEELLYVECTLTYIIVV